MEKKYEKVLKKNFPVNQKLGWCLNMIKKIEDYWKIGYGKCFVKMIEDSGLEDKVKKIKYHAITSGCFCIMF